MTGKDPKPAGSRKLPARASRPRDFGAPEPKPSRKVALDEVLRSLQDLVSNELSVETAPKPAPEKPAEPPAVAVETHTPIEPPAPAATGTMTIDFSPVTEKVPDTATEPRALTRARQRESRNPPNPLDARKYGQDESSSKTTEPPDTVAATAVPLGGLQQELPLLEHEPVSAPPAAPEAPAAPALDLEPIITELPELEVLSSAEAEPPRAIAAPDRDHNHTPTDIPVLDDVVEEIEEVEAIALPAEPDELSSIAASTLPQGVDARKLAIQVAARLNVELRKDGKPVLSSDVIARLAHALEEALAKAAANMDNDALK